MLCIHQMIILEIDTVIYDVTINTLIFHITCLRYILTPPYLPAVLPIQRDTGYNLRKTGEGSMPIIRCRLSCVRNSFLFSTMRLWNAMNPALRSSSSIEHLNMFKLNQKNNIYELPLFFLIYTIVLSAKQQLITHV